MWSTRERKKILQNSIAHQSNDCWCSERYMFQLKPICCWLWHSKRQPFQSKWQTNCYISILVGATILTQLVPYIYIYCILNSLIKTGSDNIFKMRCAMKVLSDGYEEEEEKEEEGHKCGMRCSRAVASVTVCDVPSCLIYRNPILKTNDVPYHSHMWTFLFGGIREQFGRTNVKAFWLWMEMEINGHFAFSHTSFMQIFSQISQRHCGVCGASFRP